VKYAAILYPGEDITYTDGLEALQCRPTAREAPELDLAERFRRWLAA
jgi:hypothetical protein